jgi:acyl carrier protein
MPLMSDSIQDRVLKIIANTRRIPLESVRPDSSFEELGIDSLDRLNILFDLESEFDIEIDDEEAKKVQNIPEMIAGITHLVEAKASPES